jgi:hypothetical protein
VSIESDVFIGGVKESVQKVNSIILINGAETKGFGKYAE